MEKTKAIRAEIPEELYNRLKKCVENDYTNVTGIVRDLIVDYVKESEGNQKEREEWLMEIATYTRKYGETWKDGGGKR